MTRLTHGDICDISDGLMRYDEVLRAATGTTMLGIAAHSLDVDEDVLASGLKNLEVHVIPITGGEGVITDFSATIAAIISFLGCKAKVADQCDACGLAAAYEQKADAVMLADDDRFVGIHLASRTVADNTELTGRVFASALDLMAKKNNGNGLKECPVLVLGCGPVGGSAARVLLQLGAHLSLYDTNIDAADRLKHELGGRAVVLEKFPENLDASPYILEATTSAGAIPADKITERVFVAAPGVPLGVSDDGAAALGGRLVHDKLELGTAVMAAQLAVTELALLK